MFIPGKAIEKSGNFLKGLELIKVDPLDPDYIGEIMGFSIGEGLAYKNNPSDPDTKEEKYRLTLNITNNIGEKVLDLNKTNLETIVLKYGIKKGDGYDLDPNSLIGKLVLLTAKLENNKKYSVVITVSDRLNANRLATTVIPVASPIMANNSLINKVANSIIDDIAIIAKLDDIAFMVQFPVIHNGKSVNDKRNDLATMSQATKAKYYAILCEIYNEQYASMNADSEDFS